MAVTHTALLPLDASLLTERFGDVRRATERLCEPLAIEDYGVQSMADASPVKWHLAHTSWFFETFVLAPYVSGYEPFNPLFGYLFNSYYQAVGPRWDRPSRGVLCRPTVAEIYRYRAQVDERVEELLCGADHDLPAGVADAVVLGLHHEQQHQELILTDLKHAYSLNPLAPAYARKIASDGEPPALRWLSFPEGVASVGYDGRGFAFDNELPRHREFLRAFQLANRLVTNGEYLEFIRDEGYERPEFWLADGWNARRQHGWRAPLYWEGDNADTSAWTLAGRQPLALHEPVCHVSYYEADAFARWTGARLPTEAEWERAAAPVARGHFLDSGRYHPATAPAADDSGPLFQQFGDVWQWTSSAYQPYPGYHAPKGALGEYNGKFMCNQMVLRGASCVTPRDHARLTYRNFFPPEARWQFSGVRLARDSSSR